MGRLSRCLPLFFLAASSAWTVNANQTRPKLGTSPSGCYAVAFELVFTPISAFAFEGTVTGDLEGTVTIQFDPSSVKFAGATISNSGTATWSITRGLLGPADFTTSFDNRNLAAERPGSPAGVFENIGQHRALEGVRRANLNYHGVFAVEPTPAGKHEFRGVICV